MGLAVAALIGFITVASTTSTEQSGLFRHLLPAFEKKSGIQVRVVALGTGQSLDMGKRGDADVVFVHAKALERGIARGSHVLGRAVNAAPATVCRSHVAELRSEDDLVPPPFDSPADELLVREGAVHVGRIEEVDTELERAVDRRDRLSFITSGVELGHAHASQPKC